MRLAYYSAPEIVGGNSRSGGYTLIHHCNLKYDFIQKKIILLHGRQAAIDDWAAGGVSLALAVPCDPK